MLTFIIIDDEPITRMGTLEKLSPLKDRIQCIGEADDGKEGLALIKDKHPDIVITDMKMPVLDGLSLLPVVARDYPEISLIIISGYKDFDYMKQAFHARAVDYLLKPFSSEELCAVMEKAIEQQLRKTGPETESLSVPENVEALQQNYDLQMIKSRIMGHEQDNKPFTNLRIRQLFHNRQYLLAVLYSPAPLDARMIEDYLYDNKYRESILYVSHPHTDHICYLILTMPLGNTVDPADYCPKLLRGIHALFLQKKQDILIGCSRLHEDLSDLHTAGSEAVSALNRYSLSSAEVFFFSESQKKPPRVISWEKTGELIFCIEAGKVPETRFLTEQLFDHFRKTQTLTLLDIKTSCYNISAQVRLIVGSTIPEVQQLRADNNLQVAMNQIFGFEELHDYYLGFWSNLAANLSEQDIYGDTDLIQNVKTYIEHYYQKQISVELAASLFHVNRSYLSHTFKKKTGETFIDYLNKTRVRHAKKLLAESDKKMYQIALLSGYNNVRYFYRAFKKIEGITPDQYRKR